MEIPAHIFDDALTVAVKLNLNNCNSLYGSHMIELSYGLNICANPLNTPPPSPILSGVLTYIFYALL